MARITGADCAVMCNSINITTHTHTVQGSAREGRQGICGMPGGLARRHDGEPPEEVDLREEPGVA